MSKILGLDLVTNSIGWVVVDSDQKKILGAGVRVFPEGVEKLGQGAPGWYTHNPIKVHITRIEK